MSERGTTVSGAPVLSPPAGAHPAEATDSWPGFPAVVGGVNGLGVPQDAQTRSKGRFGR